jgi:glycosyltransferase involved in cell wall biosynthesis
MKIGMLTDYVTVEFTNGPALASQAFRRIMGTRGHDVSLVGPSPVWGNQGAKGDTILFKSLPFRQYAGTPLAMPFPAKNFSEKPDFDVIHAHSNSLLMHWAPMMRKMHGIPCIHTNTIYLPAFAHHFAGDAVTEGRFTKPVFDWLTNYVETSFCKVFDESDGLIVQCQGLVDYWRKIGLEVPLHIIPRPIDPRVFERPLGKDPYRRDFKAGNRLFVVCRHAGEKSLDQLLRVFAEHILPKNKDASLTLVGDGPAHQSLRKLSKKLGIANRVEFPGEKPQRDLPEWYAYGDVFFYTSTSETFGQVISESLWMGMPVVGVEDGMGVSYQVEDGVNGFLVPDDVHQDEALGAAVNKLLSDPGLRQKFGRAASQRQRLLVDPEAVYTAYERAYEEAVEHIKRRPPTRKDPRKMRDRAHLIRQHVFPWLWKHATLAASGIVSSGYNPKSQVPFDAAPEPKIQSHLEPVRMAANGTPFRVIENEDMIEPAFLESGRPTGSHLRIS